GVHGGAQPNNMRTTRFTRNRTIRDDTSVPSRIKVSAASLGISLTTAGRAVRFFGHRSRRGSGRARPINVAVALPTLLRRAGLLLVSIILSGNSAAFAADLSDNRTSAAQSQPIPWLLGDWNGARTQLQNFGVDFQFVYTGEFASNATGGVKRTAAYTDQY